MANKTSEVTNIEAAGSDADFEDLSLESLILLINSERLKTLQDQTSAEFKELKERQEKVRKLHALLQALNKETNEKGEIDLSKKNEIMEQIKGLKEYDIPVKEDKTKYNKDERERLTESIKMSIEDLNVQNDMQLQKISRLTNERYESFQMARSILKPLHDDKLNKARALAGR